MEWEHLPVYQTAMSSTSLPTNQKHLPVYQTTRSTSQFTKQPGAPGVTPIANFCVNLAFFGCHAHLSHIAASSYANWLNTDCTGYGSLVAAVSLNTRSTSKLCVISAVALHSSPAHTASPVKDGWNLDDERNVSYHTFEHLRRYFCTPKLDPCVL